jgi:hypothetical protein
MFTTGGLTVIATVVDLDCGVDSVSLTVTVALADCAVVGVPLIVSVAPLPVAVSPFGSPVAVHLKVPFPPAAVTVPEYALPTMAVPAALLVIVSVGALTVSARLPVPVPCGDALSWTDSGTVKLPVAVGVPLIVSVAPLAVAVSPFGSPVTTAQV